MTIPLGYIDITLIRTEWAGTEENCLHYWCPLWACHLINGGTILKLLLLIAIDNNATSRTMDGSELQNLARYLI